MSKSSFSESSCAEHRANSTSWPTGGLLRPPNVKQPRHTPCFLLFLILKPEACWDVQKLLSSLPLPTSQMVQDGELCSCKPEPQTRFSARAKKAKLCFFGSWHILYLLAQHVCSIWIFGSCRPFKWKNEFSAQEDNVNEVQFCQLSYATALSIFIQFPAHQVGKLFQKRCYVIVVRK